MKKNPLILAFLAFFWTQFAANGQSTNIPLNTWSYHLIDRYQIRLESPADNYSTADRPYTRKTSVQVADTALITLDDLSEVDRFNLEYLKNDSWEWVGGSLDSSGHGDADKPVLNTFYRKKSDFLHVSTKDLDLHVNPVIYLQGGVDDDSRLTDNTNTFINTRGVEIRGVIGQKVGFYTFLADNQVRLPGYVSSRVRRDSALFGEGFFKTYKDGGFDFITARGYFTVPVLRDLIQLQFGHDKQFIGNGYRSMILSDFSDNHLFLKLRTNVWKLHYTNIFAELTAEVFVNSGGIPLGNRRFDKKYLAFHRLSYDITPRLSVGLFESTVIGDFDLGYLNPIIFYRSIEQQTGSADNAMLGLDAKWNFFSHFQLYGQLSIDEFLINDIRAGDGSWTNKFATQVGGKYIDAFGVSNLDLQGEVNVARPYIYQHRDLTTSYTSYNQPLAHPRGANFTELVGIVRAQPFKRLTLTGKLILSQYGADTASSNWGGNPLLSFNTREMNLGNEIGQGVKVNTTYAALTVTYIPFHNLFIDLKQVVRRQDSDLAVYERNTTFTSLSLRLNIAERVHEF